MTMNGLGCLIMTAVIDPHFRERLLAEPAQVMGDFVLTEDEKEALTSIRAGSFTEFAARLYRWLEERDPFHPGLQKKNGFAGFRDEVVSNDMAGEETVSASQVGTVWGAHSLRPLSVETARSIQPRYNVPAGFELALVDELS